MSRLTRADGLDLAMTPVLAGLALLGLGTTFDGDRYLVAGAIGVGAGMLAALAMRVLRQPAVAAVATAFVLYFAAAAALMFTTGVRGTGLVLVPARMSLVGWHELLTSQPPVEAGGPLLILPMLLGLTASTAALTTAMWRRRPSRPGQVRVLACAGTPFFVFVVLLAVVVLLGTTEPAALLPDGVAYAVLGLVWVAARRRTASGAPAGGWRIRWGRLALGLAVTAVAAIVAVPSAPLLAAGAADRIVLRDKMIPPFDLGAYASPLVGFRKYTKDANQLWDQELFSVTGLPDGAAVRIASLDDYDGSVWGATNGTRTGAFQRVGTTFGDTGTAVVRITIAAAYAASSDLNAWLPVAGAVGGITFAGGRSQQLSESLRYNIAGSDGIVTARLAAGDAYDLRTEVVTTAVPEDVQPFGRPDLTEGGQSMIGSRVAVWTRGSVGTAAQLKAVASYFRTNGAYTDGGKGESQYLPGHSTGRLLPFFNGGQPAGDDEQYAAAYALVANYLGVPARVVFGARPEPDGVVRGSDIHAWVELHLSGGEWATVPETEFLPDRSKKPNTQPPQTLSETNAAVVPPPNAVRLPAGSVDTSRRDSTPQPPDPPSWLEWFWHLIEPYVTVLGPPLLAVLMGLTAITAAKAIRRRRRRSRGALANRFDGGWSELMDQARDQGIPLPAGATRQQETAALIARLRPTEGSTGARWSLDGKELGHIRDLADRADRAVFGPGEPTESELSAYWSLVDARRKAMRRAAGPWRRRWARFNLRSLLPARIAALEISGMRP